MRAMWLPRGRAYRRAMDTTKPSDAERERIAERLRLAVGDGRLTLDEFDDRLRTAYAAVTRTGLEQVAADLPVPAPAGPTMTKKTKKKAAAARPDASWVDPWRSWLAAATIMIGIWFVTSVASGDVRGFWPGIPLGIWATVILAHTVGGHSLRGGCTSRR